MTMADHCLTTPPRALSEHGRSYSYDAKASGFGRGEGAACLFIKRMEDAVRDGDPIHAVIRGTACNHSGRSDGITMPNGLAQQKLLWAVHNAAGLDPSDTPVIEVRWPSIIWLSVVVVVKRVSEIGVLTRLDSIVRATVLAQG